MTFTYRSVFHPDPTEAYFARVGGTLFSRTYLPDSSYYEQADFSDATLDDLTAEMRTEDASQNLVGISALAFLVRKAGLEPVYLNVALVALAGLFFLRTCAHFGVSATAPLVVLFLNPSTVFYSQTATKEILTLFASALFVLIIVGMRGAWRTVGVLAAAALTGVFRFQTAIPMLAALPVLHASFSAKRRTWLAAFGGLALVLPLLYSSGVIQTDTMTLLRLDSVSVTGFAKYVDMGLQRIPLAGLILLPIRALHNATEPFPIVNFEEIDFGARATNIYALVLMGTVVVSWFFSIEFVRVLWRMVVKRERGPERLDSIVLYTGLFWAMAATNPIVHSRYMFNILAVFALVATINRHSRDTAVEDRTKIPLAASSRWSTMPSWLGWGALMVAWGVLRLVRI
jgi:hypothetical protein